MTRRGNVTQYGVIAIGQRVTVHQLLRGPGMNVLTSDTAIETTHTGTVTDMWVGDSGAQTAPTPGGTGQHARRCAWPPKGKPP